MGKYEETLEWLYGRLAAFHRVGAGAYKPGLENTLALCEAFANPQQGLRTIHVGGTNGKGSVSHTLASVLQKSGLRVGLYTSPHLVDFAERIRVDGQPIEHRAVVNFTEQFKNLDARADPSFFELCTVMAFDWFRKLKVDVAVIEVGLGGLYDSTNIIVPDLSVVTNVSHDHTDLLGNTLAEIALQKAGIFKPRVPALVGEALPETRPVFERYAQIAGATLEFAQDNPHIIGKETVNHKVKYKTTFGSLESPLCGPHQAANAETVMHAIDILRKQGYAIPDSEIKDGFRDVLVTGLRGRWEIVGHNPLIICDTGHNTGAWEYLGPRLYEIALHTDLQMVIGFVRDKDIAHVLDYMPRNATYHFVQASTPRAADSTLLASIAAEHGIAGNAYPNVAEGFKAALSSSPGAIFIGGSTFVVADFLSAYEK